MPGKIDLETLDKRYERLLNEGERILSGFGVDRDEVVFTSSRLIISSSLGVTGKKKQFLVIPYHRIDMFQVEEIHGLNIQGTLKIWVGQFKDPIEKKYDRSVDIVWIQKILSRVGG